MWGSVPVYQSHSVSTPLGQEPAGAEGEACKAFMRTCKQASEPAEKQQGISSKVIAEGVVTPVGSVSIQQYGNDDSFIVALKKGLTRKQIKVLFPLQDQPQEEALSNALLEKLLYKSLNVEIGTVSLNLQKEISQVIEEHLKCLQSMCKGEVPDNFPVMKNIPENYQEHIAWMFRPTYTGTFNMWGVVDKDFAGKLAQEIKGLACHEAFAGSGWLSRALREQGVNISSSDINPDMPVTDVEKLDVRTAVKQFEFDCLILSWPHPDDYEAMVEAIRNLDVNQRVIFIGHHEEGYFACPVGMDELVLEKTMEKPQWILAKEQVYFLK